MVEVRTIEDQEVVGTGCWIFKKTDYVLKCDFDALAAGITYNVEKMHALETALQGVIGKQVHRGSVVLYEDDIDALRGLFGTKFTGPAGCRAALCEHCGRQFMDHSEDDLLCPPTMNRTAETFAEPVKVHYSANDYEGLAVALADLLKQVNKFCEESGEGDFYTGCALAALGMSDNEVHVKTLNDLRSQANRAGVTK